MFPDVKFRIINIAEKTQPTDETAGIDRFTLRRVPSDAKTAVAISPMNPPAGGMAAEVIYEDLPQGHGLTTGEEFIYSCVPATK
jgi:hypothetical protein